MVSLALMFGQVIHSSLSMKISIAKHLDTVQCLHPFTYELKVSGRVKGLGFWFFSVWLQNNRTILSGK